MKIKDIANMQLETREWFVGCQNLPNYPDITGYVDKFSVKNNTVYVLKADILPYEDTFFSAIKTFGYDEIVGINFYNEIKTKEFYFIVCVGKGGVDNAYIPDEIFVDVAEAQRYVASHKDEWGDNV